jgi:hypothetical protein
MPEINGKQTECPNCHVIVSNEPSNDEYRVMTEESRLRIIKAMKASGRQNQYIECFLSNQSTITLIFRSPYFFFIVSDQFLVTIRAGNTHRGKCKDTCICCRYSHRSRTSHDSLRRPEEVLDHTGWVILPPYF